MPYKNPEDQKKAWRDHYERNKKYYYDRNKRRKEEYRAWLRSLKEGKPCSICGRFFDYRALDWHHRNPEEKSFNLGKVVSRLMSKEKVLAEIEKCDLICANCHRIIPRHSVLVPEHSL